MRIINCLYIKRVFAVLVMVFSSLSAKSNTNDCLDLIQTAAIASATKNIATLNFFTVPDTAVHSMNTVVRALMYTSSPAKYVYKVKVVSIEQARPVDGMRKAVISDLKVVVIDSADESGNCSLSKIESVVVKNATTELYKRSERPSLIQELAGEVE